VSWLGVVIWLLPFPERAFVAQDKLQPFLFVGLGAIKGCGEMPRMFPQD
jgi:hypothetical protein